MPSWTWPLLALSVGLAMDATAVAAARGLASREHAARDGTAMALAFGLFQGAMPVLGAALGASFGDAFAAWDHWVAFVLLEALGAKMLHEARTAGDEPLAPLSVRVLITQSLATSIDALAAGLTLPALGAPIVPAALTIAITTCLLAALGFALGRRLGAMAGKRFDALGGVILMVLGAVILAEHLGGIG